MFFLKHGVNTVQKQQKKTKKTAKGVFCWKGCFYTQNAALVTALRVERVVFVDFIPRISYQGVAPGLN